jgi:serine/threonine protein phosphatase PrpC
MFADDRHRDREDSPVLSASASAVFAPHHHVQPSRLLCAAATDQGRVRQGNEDRFGILPEIGLFIVADGMGGHRAGDIAAQMAVQLVCEALVNTDVIWPESVAPPAARGLPELVAAVERANHYIHGAAMDNPAWRGMGTTIAAVLARGNRAALAHAGDSRIYRLREGRLDLMTDDHSLFNELVRLGLADPDHAETFEHRNVISRALGIAPTVEVEARLVEVAPGDTLLLCSDGLTGPVAHADLASILINHENVDEAVQQLVARANECGGPDNITAVVLRWELPTRLSGVHDRG